MLLNYVKQVVLLLRTSSKLIVRVFLRIYLLWFFSCLSLSFCDDWCGPFCFVALEWACHEHVSVCVSVSVFVCIELLCYELQMLAHCENVNMFWTVDSTNSWNVPPCIAQNLTSKTQEVKYKEWNEAYGARKNKCSEWPKPRKDNNNDSNNNPCLLSRILWYDTVLNGSRSVRSVLFVSSLFKWSASMSITVIRFIK